MRTSTPALDFRLDITPLSNRGEGLCVALCDSRNDISLAGPFDCECDIAFLRRNFLDPLDSSLRFPGTFEPIATETIKQLGRALRTALLPDPLLNQIYARIVREEERRPEVLLRLHFQVEDGVTDGGWAAIPWDYLYLDAPPPGLAAGEFFCRVPGFHLARQGSKTLLPRTQPSPVEQMRVLIAWANPADRPEASYLAHIEDEIARVKTMLSDPFGANVEVVKEVPEATRGRLRKALAKYRPHILHIAAHGEEVDGGRLLLHPDDPREAPVVSGEELVEWMRAGIQAELEVRLVTLAACDTSGIARTLSRAGVPVVVAMQMPQRDDSGVTFAKHFYGHLCDPASASAAQALSRARSDAPQELGVPSLYLASENSDILYTEPRPIESDLLEARNLHFKGRDELLAKLHNTLRGDKTDRVLLYGIGGVGKSALALEYGHRYRGSYPGGVFWVNLQPDNVAESFAHLGRTTFKVSDKVAPADQARLTRNRLQERTRPTLLICDDIGDDTVAKEVHAYLPATGPCRVLILAREKHRAGDSFVAMEVPTLESERHAARALLLANAGDGALSANPVELDAADRIAADIGYLPLMLKLISNFLRDSGSDCSAYLAKYPAHAVPKQIESVINDRINLSYRKLKREAALLFKIAACFARFDISREVLWEAYRTYRPLQSIQDFDDAIIAVIRSGLLRTVYFPEETKPRLAMHEVYRGYGQAKLIQRRAEFSAIVSAISQALILRIRDANQRMDWHQVRRQMKHAYAIADLARTRFTAPPPEFADLLLEMGTYLLEMSDYDAALKHLDEGMHQLTRADQEPDMRLARFMRVRAEVKQSHYGLETARKEQDGEEARAAATKAFDIASRLLAPDAPEMAEVCNTLGYVLKMQGAMEEALPHYQRALEICEREAKIHPGPLQESRIASCLNYIGMWWEKRGGYEQARDYLARALAINRQVGGAQCVPAAIRLNNIGQIALRQRLLADAVGFHQEALEIYQLHHEPPNADIANSLFFIARAQHQIDQWDVARYHYEKAREMYISCFGDGHFMVSKIDKLLKGLG